MTEPTYVYRSEPPARNACGCVGISTTFRIVCAPEQDAAMTEAVAAWEQWTEARSFVEHTAAATRLDAAMRALREVAT